MRKIIYSSILLFISAFAFGQEVKTSTKPNIKSDSDLKPSTNKIPSSFEKSVSSHQSHGFIEAAGHSDFGDDKVHYLLRESNDDYARIRMINLKSQSIGNSFWDISGYLGNNISDDLFNIYNGRSATDVLSLRGDGRVGIGTSNPLNARTHILANSTCCGGVPFATLRLDESEDDGARLRFTNTNSAADSRFWDVFGYSKGAANEANAVMSFYYSTGAGTGNNVMSLKGDGKVGVGASTPLEKLHVGAASASSLAKFTNNFTGHTASDGLHIGLVYGNFFGEFTYSQIMNRENTNLYLGTNNLNRMTIENTGKIGIGTTIPLDQLHLNATDGTGDVFTRISSTTGFTGLRLQNLGGDWQLFSSEFDKMFLDYSPDNFANRTGVLIFEPNGANFNMMPTTSNTVFLGTSGNRWREIWSQNALNTSSDRRLKKNIVEIKYGLDEIMKLQAVSYNWKNMNDPKLQLGFIAQDVEKIVPEIVSKSGISDEEFAKLEQKGETVSDTYGMQYTGLIPVLVKAVQEQQKIIEAKSLKINQLEEKLQKMEGLEARLSVIESSLNVKKASQEVKADK